MNYNEYKCRIDRMIIRYCDKEFPYCMAGNYPAYYKCVNPINWCKDRGEIGKFCCKLLCSTNDKQKLLQKLYKHGEKNV